MMNWALSEAMRESDCYCIWCAAGIRMQISVMHTSAERTVIEVPARPCCYKGEMLVWGSSRPPRFVLIYTALISPKLEVT